MAFQVSPGVEVKEIDLTNVIPAVSTSIGAFAGHFSWGPVGEVKLVSSEKELINEYGAPVDTTTGGQYDNYTSFLQAASFLKYSNTLRISRACSTDALNAAGSRFGSLTTAKLINKEDDFAGISFGAKPGVVHARCPGTAGNSLQFKIAMPIINSGSFDDSNLNNNVSSAASTTAWAAANVAADAKDEVHIAIVDEDGVFSGVKGTILEIYEGLSLYSDAVKDGGSNYYKTVINRDSKYVFINEAAFAAEFSGSTYAAPGSAGSAGKKFNSAALTVAGIGAFGTPAVTSDNTSGAASGTYTISTEDSGVVLSDNTASGASLSVVIDVGSGGISVTSVTIVNNGQGFAVSDTIRIPETLLGSTQVDNDEFVTLTVSSVSASNSEFSFSLVNGGDGSSAADSAKAANIITALTQFQNPEAIDISLLLAEVDADGVNTIGTKVVEVCGTKRKDCVGFISPHPTADEASDVTGDLNYNNSYVVLDSSAVYVYNKYNDSYRYIPANGHIAGLCWSN